MRRELTLLFTIAVIAASCQVLACECGGYVKAYASTEERVEDMVCQSTQVFLGRVESTSLNPDRDTYTVTLIVIKAWKGIQTDRVRVTASVPRGGNCGFLFVTGRVYLVFDAGFTIRQCGGPKQRDAAWQELECLGAPQFTNPDPAVVSYPEP